MVEGETKGKKKTFGTSDESCPLNIQRKHGFSEQAAQSSYRFMVRERPRGLTCLSVQSGTGYVSSMIQVAQHKCANDTQDKLQTMNFPNQAQGIKSRRRLKICATQRSSCLSKQSMFCKSGSRSKDRRRLMICATHRSNRLMQPRPSRPSGRY